MHAVRVVAAETEVCDAVSCLLATADTGGL